MKDAAPSVAESPYAWLRLAASLALMTISGVGMYAVAVALPALQAVDMSLGAGKVGIGSFDETGVFKNVTITTTPAGSSAH